MNAAMGEPVPRTVVVVHPGSLGDVMVSVPALRALRTAFPRHHLILMAGSEVSGLLKDCGEVDGIFALEHQALTKVMAGPDAVDPTLLTSLRRCDLAVCWIRDADGLRAGLEELGVRRVIAQSPHSSDYDGLHQTDRFLGTIREVAGHRADGSELRLSGRVVEEGELYLKAKGVPRGRPLVVLHPGSGSRHKCCAPGLFVDTISCLRLRGAYPIVVGGPADGEMVGRVVKDCTGTPLVLHDMELGLAAGVISHADLFLGHDSGLTHLAAGLGVPTVALFGPTEISRWGPRGAHVLCLSGTACRCEGWNAVQICSDRSCLRIPIGQVMNACDGLLAQRDKKSPPPGSHWSACSV